MKGYIHPSQSPEAVCFQKEENRRYPRNRKKSGVRSNTKLTPDQVRWIRKNPEGLTQKEMAKQLGIGYKTLCDVVYYVTWKDI